MAKNEQHLDNEILAIKYEKPKTNGEKKFPPGDVWGS